MQTDPDTTQPDEPITPPEDSAADIAAAMDAGIEAATETPAETPAEPPVPGTNEAAAAEVVDPPVADAPVVDPAKPESDKDAETETEIAGLALKDKAADRFRGMAAEIKTFAPFKAMLDKVGVTDLSMLPGIIERSKAADDMIGMVMETGANAEQYGQTLDYLSLVNKANSGDRAAAEKAFEIAGKEYAALAEALGKEIPGVFDPLAAHPDLVAEIESGDLTRKRALEIGEQRTQAKLQGQVRDNNAQHGQIVAATEQGTNTLEQYDAQMLAGDPSYASKREALSGMVAFIKGSLPPNQWLAATQQAYATIQTPAVPAPVALPAPGPMRPGLSRPVLVPDAMTPEQAMDFGIAAASH